MQDVIGILSGIVVIIGMILAFIGANVERKEELQKAANQAIFDSQAEFRAEMVKNEAKDYLVKEVVPGVFEQPVFEPKSFDQSRDSNLIIRTSRVLTENEKREIEKNIKQGATYVRLDPPYTELVEH